MTPPVVVSVLDGVGALVGGAEVPQVTLALAGAGATLAGTLTRPNGGGQATFNDLHVNNPGTYTLVASAPGSFNAPSASFNIKVDSPPVANNDAYAVNEDQTLTTASANESLPPGTLENDRDEIKDGPGLPRAQQLTAVLVTPPAHGTLTLNTNGGFTYTPNANYNGPDSFTYRATDGSSNSNPATVSIGVTPVNDEIGRAHV